MALSWRRDVEAGDLGVLEFESLQFIPRRFYWITNFVNGTKRGHHAHKTLHQYMFAIRGIVLVELRKGNHSEIHELREDSVGLYVTPGTWRVFWSNEHSSVLGVICDQPFSDGDYIRNFDEYIQWLNS